MNKINLSKVIEHSTKVGVFLFFLFFFLFKDSFKIGAFFLTFVSIINIFALNKSIKVNKPTQKLIFAWLVFGVISIGINFIHDNPSWNFKFGILSLFVPLIIILFQEFPIKPKILITYISISTIIGSTIGLYNIFVSHQHRVTVNTINTIHFSNIMQLFSMCCLIGLSLNNSIKNKKHKNMYTILCILACVGGITMSILSYSRGSWLALPFQLILIGLFYFKTHKKTVYISSIVLALSLVIVYQIPQTKIKERISLIFDDVNNHSKGDANSSNGSRLELYKFGYFNFIEKPIFGVPREKINENRITFVDKYNIDPLIRKPHLGHFHNHFIQIVVMYGLIGLLSLLGIYYFSFRSFFKKNRTFKVLGILILGSYLIYNLTDLIFYWDIGFILFVFLTSILNSEKTKYLKNEI